MLQRLACLGLGIICHVGAWALYSSLCISPKRSEGIANFWEDSQSEPTQKMGLWVGRRRQGSKWVGDMASG